MQASIPEQMKVAAINRYGGPEVFHVEELPVPRPRGDEVLIRLDAAGVGVWDPAVRSGEFEIGERRFPKVIGNDGAGEVVAVGSKVKQFRTGDRVYAYAMDGGFYAEYVAVMQDSVAKLPAGLNAAQ